MAPIDNPALRELCNQYTRSPQDVAVAFLRQEEYRQRGQGDSPWAGMMDRLKNVGAALEDDAAESAGVKDELLEHRRRQELAEEQERYANFAASEFLRRVGEILQTEPEWSAQDFTEQLPQFEEIALAVAIEKKLSLPDLWKAIQSLVSKEFSGMINSKFMDFTLGSLDRFHDLLGPKQRYVNQLVREIATDKSEEQLEEVKKEIRQYFKDLLSNTFS